MRTYRKFFAGHFIKPFLKNYLRKERGYTFQKISIRVFPGVFHPGFFFSTKYLIRYLDQQDLNQKSFLELGAGTGLISFFAEKKGAKVTATDLSKKAIKNLLANKSLLKSPAAVIHSDLFFDIPPQQFEYVVINPPYYEKDPRDESELAWYCGEHCEYFENMFSRLAAYTTRDSVILMILSEECNLEQVRRIASSYHFYLKEVSGKKIWGEWNYIFKIYR